MAQIPDNNYIFAPSNILDRLTSTATGLLLALLLILYVLAMLWFPFYADEIEAVHTAWKISIGERIYVDFFQHHNPLLYYFLVPVLRVADESAGALLVARAFNGVFGLPILLVSYLLARMVFDRRCALTAVLLTGFSMVFLTKAIEVRPDVGQTLFGLAGVVAIFAYFRTRRIALIVISGLCLGIAFLFLQKVILLVMPLGLVLLIRAVQRTMPVGHLLLWCLVVLASGGSYAAYQYATGHFGDYFTLSFTLNSLAPAGAGHFGWTRLGNGLDSVGALILAFAGCSLVIRKDRKQWEFTAIAAAVLLATTLYRTQYVHYYLLALPLVAVLAAHAVHRLCGAVPFGPVLIAFAASLPAGLAVGRAATQDVQQRQLAEIEFVLNNTTEKDYVIDGLPRFNLFRHDVHFFWFGVYSNRQMDKLRQIRTVDYDDYDLIDRYNPKFIYSGGVADIADPRISARYRPVDQFPVIYERTR